MDKPLILLTNDDGIDSPYLKVMASVLEDVLAAEILIIAPERQRSAMSHTITLHKPLRVEARGRSAFAVSGTPVDCVYSGVMRIASRQPALVVSGPNDGYNLGTDVFYSGTVGAAVEGGLRGIPSVAVSVASKSPQAVPGAARLVANLAKGLMAEEVPRVINVNVPASCEGRVRWTSLGKRFYEDDVHERHDPRGREYFWIGGGVAGIANLPGSDCEAVVTDGIASITPLNLNMTESALLGDDEPTWPLGEFVVG